MAILNQVRKAIKEHKLITRGDKIVVAVSGGPDSLALLHLLLALRDECQIQLFVAHLNHQLRGAEADGDAEFVKQLAREWGLSATVESRNVAGYANEKRISIEEAAREMRYAFLTEVAQSVTASAIAVAHNADDQAETVLMHLLRGAGMAGLRGMQYKTRIQNSKFRIKADSELQIIRPLLDVYRSDIEAYCKKNSLTPRYDGSNLDTKLFRNRLRHEVLPYLELVNPKIRKILTHTARSITDDFDYVESRARAAFLEMAHITKDKIVFNREAWSKLHPALQRLTLRLAVQQLRGDRRNIDWSHIEDARGIVLTKGTGASTTLPDGLLLTNDYHEFTIRDEKDELALREIPQLSVEFIAVKQNGVFELPGSEWVIEINNGVRLNVLTENWTATLDSEKITGALALRRRRAGDRFQPAGMGGHTKSVHEFMIDEKIPRARRERLPLVVDSEKILWVCGYRADERARVTDATREVMQIVLRKK